ncbi:MAG TPA: hypothetical protein VME67_20325 [Mycobacterium sp.]|nr:hypothetical protein [Mycobacterium sp.]HTX96979.1 hypothetical protein [Mycobacterium sp.]
MLVVDGPLRDRAHLVRALGYNKTHHAQYLPPDLNAMVAALGTAERTPIFAIATGWSRYSWYLRLPCLPSGAWTGIVRLETANLAQRQFAAGPPQRPAGAQRLVKQLKQPGLGGHVDSAWDPAT